MLQTRTKMPAEAVELYTRFIHGDISRRAFVNGVKRYAIAGMTVTASAPRNSMLPCSARVSAARATSVRAWRQPSVEDIANRLQTITNHVIGREGAKVLMAQAAIRLTR